MPGSGNSGRSSYAAAQHSGPGTSAQHSQARANIAEQPVPAPDIIALDSTPAQHRVAIFLAPKVGLGAGRMPCQCRLRHASTASGRFGHPGAA